MTNSITRYISVRNNGDEVYVENIPATGRMREHVPAAKLRLREIQRAMPLGKWSIRIEQQWPEGSSRHFQMLDVATGKTEEQIL